MASTPMSTGVTSPVAQGSLFLFRLSLSSQPLYFKTSELVRGHQS